MLDWLWRYFVFNERSQSRAVPPVSNVRVVFDEDVISLTRLGGMREVMSWSEIATLGLVTGDALREPPELFWLLQGKDRRRSLLIPMGADGEHELVHEMQARLAGFDNMAVVEAMSATGAVGFVVWDCEWPKPLSGL